VSQQINLFNPVYLKQKKHFSAVTMVQALGLILLGSILLSAYMGYQLSVLEKEASITTAQLAAAQTQLGKVNATYGVRQKSTALQEEVRKAETDMKSLLQVFDTLQKGEFGNTKGYAEYMRAFSRQSVPGLWLTGFSIVGAGTDIGLMGRTLQPELVPAYLGRLRQEKSLRGKSFSTLEMESRSAASANPGQATGTVGGNPSTAYIEFSLGSAGMAKEQNTPARGASK
jgi:hypothetical protein